MTDVGGEDMMEGEEGGGWDVDDDELELPPDLVSLLSINIILYNYLCNYHLNQIANVFSTCVQFCWSFIPYNYLNVAFEHVTM